jgi:hypothetical protein
MDHYLGKCVYFIKIYQENKLFKNYSFKLKIFKLNKKKLNYPKIKIN